MYKNTRSVLFYFYKTIPITQNCLTFAYDAAGNRIKKETEIKGFVTKTYYTRDAQGNVLAIYTNDQDGNNDFYLSEVPLYGSSRLGEWRPRRLLDIAAQENTITTASGEKTYELSNHLGNVLAVVSDALVDDAPVVVSATDYYAFGQEMVGRTFASEDYRYGMNGQEKDLEIGDGIMTAMFWEYDSRIGRRWNVDPVVKIWRSSYDAFDNNPILRIDIDGDDDYYTQLGKLVFSTSTGTKSLCILQSHADIYNGAMKDAGAALGANSTQTQRENWVTEKGLNLSGASVEIQDNITQEQISTLWKDSNPVTEDNKPIGSAVEQNALIVFNITTDKDGKLLSASINLEVQDASKNTSNGSQRGGMAYNNERRAGSTKTHGAVIGGFHTHPTGGRVTVENVSKKVNGKMIIMKQPPITHGKNAKTQTQDLGNFTKTSYPQRFPEYMLDYEHYDKIIPNATPGGTPTPNNDYKKADDKTFKIGKDALESYGKNQN